MPGPRILVLFVFIMTACLVSACKQEVKCPEVKLGGSVEFYPTILSKEQYADAPDLTANDVDGYLLEKLSSLSLEKSRSERNQSAFAKVLLVEGRKQYDLSLLAQISQIAGTRSGVNTVVTETTRSDGSKTVERKTVNSVVDEKLSLALNNIPKSVGVVCKTRQASTLLDCDTWVRDALFSLHNAASKNAFVVMPELGEK